MQTAVRAAITRRNRTATRAVPEPFDVPTDHGFTALRRDGDTLIGVLAIAPDVPRPIVQGLPERTAPAALLPAITAALAMSDAAPRSVDVVSHSMTCGPDGPAARAYRTLLGPLPIASHRGVHLVVRMRPADHPAAVAARGGGAAGLVRTALWCMRRLRGLLAEEGVDAAPLTAAQITGLTARLTAGSGRDPLCRTPAHRDPESLARILAAPVGLGALSTTAILQIVRGGDGPRVRMIVRDNGAPAESPALPGLVTLPDTPHTVTCAGVPIGCGLDSPVPLLDAAQSAEVLRSVAVPRGGDGQLIGADANGAPVTLRLAGPNADRTDIVGDPGLARQTAVRLAALGVPTVVVTDSALGWERLADAVGGVVRLGGPVAGAGAVIDDSDAGDVVVPPGTSLIRVRSSGDTSSNTCAQLRQRPDGSVDVAAGGVRVTVRPVSTPAERSLVDDD